MENDYILIVDDDSDIRNLIGIYLENEGYKDSKGGNSAAALEVVETTKVALILLDYERLARVFQNLFANAAKYAQPHTVVRLGSRISGSEMQITLSNRLADGETVDTASMFDRFYKQDRSRTDSSGAGLGLAIAKRIVELHGGSIGAQTADGEITVMIKLNKA